MVKRKGGLGAGDLRTGRWGVTEQRAKVMGATAAAGAKRAASMTKKSRKRPNKSPKQRPLLVGTPRDRELRDALVAYNKARAAFLKVTGERTVEAAVARSTTAVKRIEEERRQQSVRSSAAPKPKKAGAPRKIIFDSSRVPADEKRRSTSVRTVSGGAPGLGKRG
jgi:hypothetical protein